MFKIDSTNDLIIKILRKIVVKRDCFSENFAQGIRLFIASGEDLSSGARYEANNTE